MKNKNILFIVIIAMMVISCSKPNIKHATIITVDGDTVEFVGGEVFDEGTKFGWKAVRMTRITPLKKIKHS